MSIQAYISTVLFDDSCEILYDRVPVGKVEPMNDKQYYVRGCTALLDAIGGAIHHIANVHKYAREEDRPEKTLFIITTDGMENASHKYSFDKVKKMVDKEKRSTVGSFYSLEQALMRLKLQEGLVLEQTELLTIPPIAMAKNCHSTNVKMEVNF